MTNIAPTLLAARSALPPQVLNRHFGAGLALH